MIAESIGEISINMVLIML